MNLYLQTVLEILLVLLITYFTQVYGCSYISFSLLTTYLLHSASVYFYHKLLNLSPSFIYKSWKFYMCIISVNGHASDTSSLVSDGLNCWIWTYKVNWYITWFSADSLTVESLLELLDEDILRKDTALPCPEWSSDHIALLAEFRCKPRTRRGWCCVGEFSCLFRDLVFCFQFNFISCFPFFQVPKKIRYGNSGKTNW